MNYYLLLFLMFFGSLLSACTVGPNYHRPPVIVPAKFKEAPKGWKFAEPRDTQQCGSWWQMFHDPQLNELEAKINVTNQSIAMAEAQYRQALAIITQARAGYFPTVSGNVTTSRQQSSSNGGSNSNTNSSSTSSTSNTTTNNGSAVVSNSNGRISLPPFSTYSLSFSALWEPDIWGSVRRTVEAAKAGAQASAAQLAATRLSMQATLAQNYFQLRALDVGQKVLDDAVVAYKASLKLTKYRYQGGVVALTDVVQAESQLKTAEAQAFDNHIFRQQFEHAIAMLVGLPPANFCLPPKVLPLKPPTILLQVPTVLLERRPDVAQAERLMAQANAQIGVAIAALFPTLTLSGNYGYSSSVFEKWFSPASRVWSLAASVADTLFDGGLRYGQILGARAAYDQTVASYRQVVLTSFQDVEDNLVALRQLQKELVVQKQAVTAAKQALNLVMIQYQAGTVNYLSVIVTQTTLYTAEKTVADVLGRQMVAAVGLVKALGGGWDPLPLWITRM
ncbi:efflux transporter outer membrane subunit [soil metagenome]